MKSAFTLLELIVVIVILTFIGVFGLTQIANIYESFMIQKTTNELETDAKVALGQISSRISSGLKESMVILNSSYSCIKPIANASGEEVLVFAWIGADKALLNGMWNGTYNAPGLSNFVDLNLSNAQTIITPGSNFNYANEIISKLSGKNTPLSTANFVALYFGQSTINTCDAFFNQATSMHGAVSFGTNSLTLSKVPIYIAQYYTASWSAYAIEYKAIEKTLYLKYNFRPWLGENAANAQSAILTKNVSGFGVRNENGLIRLNLCLSKNTSGLDIKVCKESAVF